MGCLGVFEYMKEAHMPAETESSKNSEEVNQKSENAVRPGADIVASMTDDLRKQLIEMVDKGVKQLELDLSDVEMVDSVGLGVIIAAHNSLNASGGKLTVTNVSEDIYRLFKTMRLNQHFDVQQAA